MAYEPSKALRERAEQLLAESGETYAHEAGIRLKDTPSPLYQLLVLSTLLSTRISASIAVSAAREISGAGWRTPQAVLDAPRKELVDALGRAHYRRYDESTATALRDGAELLIQRWHGDLRQLRQDADGDPARIRQLLQEFPRIGPVGAEIFCREVQGLWEELRPAFDRRALDGAENTGLPQNPERLAASVAPEDLPRLAAALVRATL
jgi:hypothetical protein